MLSGETSSPPGLIGPPHPTPHTTSRSAPAGSRRNHLVDEFLEVGPQQLRAVLSDLVCADRTRRPLPPRNQRSLPVDQPGCDLGPTDVDGERQVGARLKRQHFRSRRGSSTRRLRPAGSVGTAVRRNETADVSVTRPARTARPSVQLSRRWKRERNQSRASLTAPSIPVEPFPDLCSPSLFRVRSCQPALPIRLRLRSNQTAEANMMIDTEESRNDRLAVESDQHDDAEDEGDGGPLAVSPGVPIDGLRSHPLGELRVLTNQRLFQLRQNALFVIGKRHYQLPPGFDPSVCAPCWHDRTPRTTRTCPVRSCRGGCTSPPGSLGLPSGARHAERRSPDRAGPGRDGRSGKAGSGRARRGRAAPQAGHRDSKATHGTTDAGWKAGRPRRRSGRRPPLGPPLSPFPSASACAA